MVSGAGSISQSGSVTDIQESSQDLVIDWLSFNIGSQETVNFLQPSASAIAVNQILSTNGSQILGHLNANGQVWLVNPNGVLFGQGAQVDVGGLVASTLDASNPASSGNTRSFGGDGTGSVINEGTINAANGGYVALLGNQVSNQGTITAKLGTVVLGAGNAATLTFDGNSLVRMQVDRSTLNNLAANGGLIQADGGRVIMNAGAQDALLASVVNNTGVIEARTVENHEGTITLLGGMTTGTVNVGGTLDASAPDGGAGGFIETSAAHVEVANGSKVTTAAPQGQYGTWLIDPTDFTVAASGGDITGTALSADLNSTNFTILSSNGNSPVTGGGGGGNINVNAAVSWSANTTLTLTAANNIRINKNITATGASAGLTLQADTSNGSETASGTGTSYIASGSTVSLAGGTLAFTNGLNLSGTISGGTLVSSDATPLTSSSSGTLNGVTLGNATSHSLTLKQGGELYIANGLNLYNGFTFNIGNNELLFEGPNYFTGASATPSIAAVGAANATATINTADALICPYNYPAYTEVLTIGAGVTLQGYGDIKAADQVQSIVNNGTIASNTAGQTLYIVQNTFTNNGVLSVSAGTLSITQTSSYTNTGTTNVSGGTLDLGAPLTTSSILGSAFTRTGGSVDLSGTLNNTGNTLDIGSSGIFGTGGLTQFSGTISGGTLVSGDGTALNSSSGTLNGVTLGNATSHSLTLKQGGELYIANGLNLYNGFTFNIGNNTLNFEGPEFFTGASATPSVAAVGAANATATVNTASGSIETDNRPSSTEVLTIGAGVTIQGYGEIADYSSNANGYGQSIVNNGTIASNTAAQTLIISPNAFTNNGTLSASSGATLQLAGTAETLSASGSVSGAGTLLVSSGTNNVSGAVTVGIYDQTGGTWSQIAAALPSFAATNFSITGGTFIRALGGTGAAATPYQLTDAYGLQGVGSAGMLTKSYTLANNIDLTAAASWNSGGGFVPIGSSAPAFTGSFNGAGYTLSNLTVNLPSTADVGLFGADGAASVIQNVGLIGGSVKGGANSGMLVGLNAGTLSNDYATGGVNGTSGVGGLVGNNTGTISNSYATGTVTGTSSEVGGLVGYNQLTITDSYSLGSATGTTYVGGLAGKASVTATATGSFWNTTTSGLSSSAGGIGMTTAQMQQQANFTSATSANGNVNPNWDFTGTWVMYNGDTYPLLRAFMTPLTVTANNDATTYNGTAFSGGNGVTYSTAPSANLLGTVSYSGTSQGAVNAGGYVITPGGLYSNQQGYIISYDSGTLTINPATLTVSGLTGTNRTYNGSVSDALSGTAVLNGLVGSETLVLGNDTNGTLASANAGSEPITTAMTIGNGTGLASNYTLIQPTLSNVAIAQAPLTITGLSGTNRTYDGSLVDALAGTAVLNGLIGSETLTLGNVATGLLASKNAGSEAVTTGATIANGTGLASNYSLTQPTLSNVTIAPAALTLSAVTDSKTYDGTTNSSQTPTVTGTVFSGDTLSTLTQSFASKNVLGANGSTLNVNSYTLSDGNSGNNYSVTVDSAAGTITPASLVLSAVSQTKTYDGTTNSTGTPTVSGTVFSGDTLSPLTQSFASKNVLGANGSTLNVNSYTLNDGNNGNNYSVTVDSAAGTITPASLVLNAVTQTKAYDGTTGSTGTPTVTGTVFSGDTLSPLTQSFASKNVLGTNGSTLNVNGYTLNDGNNGNNYSVMVNSAAGTITPLASVAWVGGATGNWSTASNWAGGIIPDLANVLAVTIPAGKTVTYDSGVGNTMLSTLTDSGNLIMAAGNLSTTGNMNTAGFQQSGGTLDVGGTLTIRSASGGVTLGDISAGALTVISKAGAITQLAATDVGVTGTTTLTADNGLSGASAVYYGITLADAGNHFGGAVTSTGSNTDLLQSTGGLILGATTATGSFTADSLAGAITQSAGKAVDVTGAASLTADNGLSGASDVKYGITLAGTTNSFAGPVAADGLAISLLDSSSSGLALGNVTATGALTLTSRAGALTQSASTRVDAVGATKLTADNGLTGASAVNYGITLANAGNQFGAAVTSIGSNIDLVQSTGGLILGATTATGTFTADSTAGTITQSASTAVNATGATSLTANNGGAVNYAITLAQAGNNFLGGVTAEGSAITLKDAGALTAILDSSGASTLTSVGAMNVSGTVGTTLRTTTTGTNAATTFGATTVGTTLTVTSTGAVTETSSNILTVHGEGTTTVSNPHVTVNGVVGVEIPAP